MMPPRSSLRVITAPMGALASFGAARQEPRYDR